jgi:hypothetical protein
MTDISPTLATNLVACAHCGHLDQGTYCSSWGKELAPTGKHVLAEAWEHIVMDRVEDLREYAVTTWWIIARPLRFFRTAMTGPAQRAGHVFPHPVPEALPRSAVQSPVKYLVLSFIASVLASKATGTQVGELVPGVGEELNTEFSILLLMTYLGLYGLGFHWSTGRRISVEEAAVFNAYVAAAAIISTALMTLTPESMTWVLLAELALFIYVGTVVPYKVLPRLYPMSKRRVFVAQIGAFIGATVLLLIGIGIVMVIANTIKARVGG